MKWYVHKYIKYVYVVYEHRTGDQPQNASNCMAMTIHYYFQVIRIYLFFILFFSSWRSPDKKAQAPYTFVCVTYQFLSFYIYIYLAHFYFPASGQAVVTGVIPSPPRFLPSIFIAHKVQQSHCTSIVHRVLLTHALALSASQIVHKKKSQRIYTSMHSAGLELTKLTYTRLEDNLIRHRGDRSRYVPGMCMFSALN